MSDNLSSDFCSLRILRKTIVTQTLALARSLLGMELLSVHEGSICGGRIVEVEAYPQGDPASHAFRGRTPRCHSMFLPPWTAYVYRIYGRLFCLNITSEAEGIGAAVLIRALEPSYGVSVMQQRRQTEDLLSLTRGPGRLTQALGITLAHDGEDLDCSSKLILREASPPDVIAYGPRIGISAAVAAPFRLFDPTSRYVSGAKRVNMSATRIAFQDFAEKAFAGHVGGLAET